MSLFFGILTHHTEVSIYVNPTHFLDGAIFSLQIVLNKYFNKGRPRNNIRK